MTASSVPLLLPLLLFAGALINGVFGSKFGKGFVTKLACAFPIVAFALVFGEFLSFVGAPGETWTGVVTDLGPWLQFAGDDNQALRIDLLFQIDRLTLLMAMIVTGVGALIHVYATGYMADVSERRFARFFCYLNLFMAMMLVLITGGNLLLLFVGWEGVGLCSYLLIGFEYEEDWKAAAGMKAFIANRVGDFALLLGLFLLVQLAWQMPGREATDAATLGFDQVRAIGVYAFDLMNNAEALTDQQADFLWQVGLAALCLFLGATGKSAQIPLFIWLPDAMAGPTPVSALIHAATMVTAGIYLLVRNGVFFAAAQINGLDILELVAIVGALTAFVAATAALVQSDLKKVLAYSTISQLGYMFIGVGALAYGSAVFHLMTHAFFKALLFLGAGAVIHALHGEQNMLNMGGLRKHLPYCFYAFAAGSLALSGFPLIASGFYSKDAILFAAYERYVAAHSSLWLLVFGLGLSAAVLTACYTTRMLLLTFFGAERTPPKTLSHLHRPTQGMTFALIALIVLSLSSGWLGLPPTMGGKTLNLIEPYLEPYAVPNRSAFQLWAAHHNKHKAQQAEEAQLTRQQSTKPQQDADQAPSNNPSGPPKLEETWHHIHHSAELFSLMLSVLAVFLGIALGFRSFWLKVPKEAPAGSFKAFSHEFLREAWGFDAFYQSCLVNPFVSLSRWTHRVVDVAVLDQRLIEGSGRLSLFVSELVTTLQTGRVTHSAVYLATGAIVMLTVAFSFAKL